MKPKILLSEDINPYGKKILENKAELIIAPDTSEETTIELIKDVTGLILRATTQINKHVLSHAAKLKIIARTGVGVDNVDIEEASKKGILVCNFPGMNNLTVAEQTISMIMSLSKQTLHMHNSVKNGNWNERFSTNQIEVSGRTLGVIGMGQIGQLVAHKCHAGLGMNILAYDPYVSDKTTNPHINFVPKLETLFSDSDFISIHVPNLKETKGMVNKKMISLMKKTAFIINTSRGEVIIEEDLIKALQNNELQGAALDVFQEEPLSLRNPLQSMKNVLLSPHCAGSTWESNVRIATGAAQAVLDVIEGNTPSTNIYNKDLISK